MRARAGTAAVRNKQPPGLYMREFGAGLDDMAYQPFHGGCEIEQVGTSVGEAGLENGGAGGIRTHEQASTRYTISSRAP